MMNFQTFSTTDAYNTFRLSVLLKVEESGIPKTLPYLDGKQIPTMGIGFNLRVKFNRDKILTEMGFNVNATGKEKEYLDLIEAAVDLAYSSGSAGLDALKTNLDAVMSLWAADASVISHNGKPKRSIFTLDTTEINTVFDSIAPDYEKLVNAWAAKYGFVATDSRERAVFLSLAWNSQDKNSDGIPDLLGDGLGRAIAQGNRAEAWFEIRYGSNGDKLAGIAKRRYYEAETFGLYNDPANVTVDDAKQVYRMFTSHRAKIADYELKYGVGFDGSVTTANYINGLPPLYAANRDYGLSSANAVKAIHDELASAKPLILADLLMQNPGNFQLQNALVADMDVDPANDRFLSTNIYLADPIKGTTLYSSQLDTVVAEVMIGGDGGDFLFGGKGDDVLAGGKGYDTYIYRTGDGNDLIADSDNKGRIVIYDGTGQFVLEIAAGQFTQGNGNVWSNADGTITLTHNSPWTLHLSDGSTINLGDNFQSGDFGINLVTASSVTPTLTLTGDIIPTDIDPTKAGIQAAGDANGNPIGTAGAYEDILIGTTGDDHILSGALNDDIGGRAGNDWIEGGTGSDYIIGEEGNDLIEGGADADILAGNAGNDQLYGNTKVTTAAAIANGNSDIADNIKGDWLAGNAGDDTLIAGASDDVLSGGGGNDLLIAGAGDDYILGDSDYTASYTLETTPRYSVGSINLYHTSRDPFNWIVTVESDGDYLFQPAAGTKNPADSGNDTIYAGDGKDHVWAGVSDDVVFGEGDNDIILGEAGNDTLLGGAGDDHIEGDASYIDASLHGDDYFDGGDGNDILYGDGGNDTLFGGAGNDQLTGDGDNIAVAYQSNDYLDGEGGDDLLAGNGGDDELFGGDGADQMRGDDGNDYLDGEAGNDIANGGNGNDTLFGGAGDDILYGDNADGTATAAGDDYIDGEDGNDTVAGDGGNDTLYGGNDNDLLDGGTGDDYLSGDAGIDQLQGGAGNDTLLGGDGNDTLIGQDGDDMLDGGDGINYLDGGAGNDALSGGTGDDTLLGGDGSDTLVSGDGNNWLDGGAGNDALSGGTGDDTLLGGAGDDTLIGGGGHDYLDGGEGNDIYVLSDQGASTNGVAHNTINDPNGSNAIQFSDSTLTSSLVFQTAQGNSADFVLQYGQDQLYIKNGLTNEVISNLYFSNGQVLTRTDIMALAPALTISGGAGNDNIIGGAKADILIGGAGNDILQGGGGDDQLGGGAGNDIYLFNREGGQDTIDNTDTSTDYSDTLLLGAGIEVDDVTLKRIVNNLIVSINNTTDQVEVLNHFSSSSINSLQFADGTVRFPRYFVFQEAAFMLPVSLSVEQ